MLTRNEETTIIKIWIFFFEISEWDKIMTNQTDEFFLFGFWRKISGVDITSNLIAWKKIPAGRIEQIS